MLEVNHLLKCFSELEPYIDITDNYIFMQTAFYNSTQKQGKKVFRLKEVK